MKTTTFQKNVVRVSSHRSEAIISAPAEMLRK